MVVFSFQSIITVIITVVLANWNLFCWMHKYWAIYGLFSLPLSAVM